MSSADDEQLVYALAAAGWPSRRIAVKVYGDPRLKDRVLRLLARRERERVRPHARGWTGGQVDTRCPRGKRTPPSPCVDVAEADAEAANRTRARTPAERWTQEPISASARIAQPKGDLGRLQGLAFRFPRASSS